MKTSVWVLPLLIWRQRPVSGSVTFIRTSTPDLVSWDAVPFGQSFFGSTSGGSPLYQSNKTAGAFTDQFAETAALALTDNPDGTRTLGFYRNFHRGYTKIQGLSVQWRRYPGLVMNPLRLKVYRPTTGCLMVPRLTRVIGKSILQTSLY